MTRGIGRACDEAARCAEGSCVDGFCCESACEGTCLTCARADVPGRCVLAEDNSDRRGHCGLCAACYSGSCAPAVPGTDPNRSCPDGLACSPEQACGVMGDGCDEAHPCAIGQCLAGRCLRARAEEVRFEGMFDKATSRDPMSLAAGPNGAIAVLFAESSNLMFGSLTVENDLMLAVRARDGAWSVVRLQTDRCGTPALGEIPIGSTTFLGPTILVSGHLVATTAGCGPETAPRGTFTQLVFPSGLVGRPTSVAGEAGRDHRHELVDQGGGALLLVRERDGAFIASTRTTGAEGSAWSEPFTLPAAQYISTWAIAPRAEGALLFDFGEGDTHVRARALTPAAEPHALALPPDAVVTNLRAASAGTTVDLAFNWGTTTYEARLDPATWTWTTAEFPEDILAAEPLGKPAFAGGARVIAYLRRWGNSGEAGIAVQRADAGWTFIPAFVPVTGAVASIRATLDADGFPVLLVATGTPARTFVTQEDLHLVRLHP